MEKKIVYVAKNGLDSIGEIKNIYIVDSKCDVVELSDRLYLREIDGFLYLDREINVYKLSDSLIKKFHLEYLVEKGVILRKVLK